MVSNVEWWWGGSCGGRNEWCQQYDGVGLGVVVVDVVVSTVGWWWGDKKNLIRIIDNVTLTLNIRRLFLNNG